MKRTARFGTRLMRRTSKGFLRIVVSVVLGGGAAVAQEAAAQDDCAEVIRMSRHTASVVQTQDHFEEHAQNFCDAYRSNQSSSRSRSYQASYELLAGSMSGSRTSESQVASQYCSANRRESRRQDAYEQYLNTVSPGAFSAYATCKKFSSTGTQIALSAVHKTEMFVTLRNSLDTGEARIKYSGTRGIDCRRDASDANEQSQDPWVLKPRSAAVVKCNRPSPTQADSVIVYTSTSPNTPLTFPWSAYNTEGKPVDSLRDLQRDVRNVNTELGALEEKNDALQSENSKLSNAVQGYMNRQWCDVTGQRGRDAVYKNDEKHPIEIAVTTNSRSSKRNFCDVHVYVTNPDGEEVHIVRNMDANGNSDKLCSATVTVPPGQSYKVKTKGLHWAKVIRWTELRGSCPQQR